jgi:hypothetical protein
VASFAVMLSSRQSTPDGILLMVDERRDAMEIAFELQRKGHAVTVREVTSTNGQPGVLPDPSS